MGGAAADIGAFERTPPSFTTQPADQAVAPGEMVTLTALATSWDGAPVAYQWRKDGVPIPGATGASYTTGDAGRYEVVATSRTEAGASASATVTVAVDMAMAAPPDLATAHEPDLAGPAEADLAGSPDLGVAPDLGGTGKQAGCACNLGGARTGSGWPVAVLLILGWRYLRKRERFAGSAARAGNSLSG